MRSTYGSALQQSAFLEGMCSVVFQVGGGQHKRQHTEDTYRRDRYYQELSLATLTTVRFMDFLHCTVIQRGHDGLTEP